MLRRHVGSRICLLRVGVLMRCRSFCAWWPVCFAGLVALLYARVVWFKSKQKASLLHARESYHDQVGFPFGPLNSRFPAFFVFFSASKQQPANTRGLSHENGT